MNRIWHLHGRAHAIALLLLNHWLRRIFLTAVWALGLKALIYDFIAKNMTWSHATPTVEQ
jgi:hypothetical protein